METSDLETNFSSLERIRIQRLKISSCDCESKVLALILKPVIEGLVLVSVLKRFQGQDQDQDQTPN